MMNRIAMLLVVAIALSGCGGGGTQPGATSVPTTQQIIFDKDEPMNLPLPPEFKTRVFYEKDDILLYELNDIPGSLLLCTTTGDETTKKVECALQYPPIIKEGSTPHVATPDKVIYNSKVDQGAKVEGSLLLFTAGFSAEQVAEVTITDATYVSYPSEDVPVSKLKNHVRQHPNGNMEKEKRYWIKAIKVSTIVRKDYRKLDIGTSGVIGPVSGIKGSVYRAEKNDTVSYRVSFTLVDIDRDLIPILPKTSLTPAPAPQAPEQVLTIGGIKGLEQLPVRKLE